MNLRLSILLVSVLSTLLVALFVPFGGQSLVDRLTESDDGRPDRPWLYRMDDSSLSYISVAHQGLTVEYAKKPGTFDWYIQGPGGTLVFQGIWGGKTLLLSGPKVSRVVSDEIEDPTIFGLDPPVTQVIVTDRLGSTIEFHLGDVTPDSVDQYVRLVGDDSLFTVPVAWADVVNLLATEPPFLRLYQVEGRRISLLEVTFQEQTTAYRWDGIQGTWLVTEPDSSPVSMGKWGDTTAFISGPEVDERIALDFDEPAKYGLEPPQAQAVVVIPGVAPTVFHLGAITDDGQHRYARVVGEPELYIMPIAVAQRIIDLAINPPL